MTHNPEEPIYFGCKFKPFTKQVRYSFGNTNLQVFGSVSKLIAGIDEFYVLTWVVKQKLIKVGHDLNWLKLFHRILA